MSAGNYCAASCNRCAASPAVGDGGERQWSAPREAGELSHLLLVASLPTAALRLASFTCRVGRRGRLGAADERLHLR